MHFVVQMAGQRVEFNSTYSEQHDWEGNMTSSTTAENRKGNCKSCSPVCHNTQTHELKTYHTVHVSLN